MMFCGYCDQKCGTEYSANHSNVTDYGQTEKKTHVGYFCDKACLNAKYRSVYIPKMERFVESTKTLKLNKNLTKDEMTGVLMIRTLREFLQACLNRRPLHELEMRQGHAKRMFDEIFADPKHELFVYCLSENRLYLQGFVLEAWAS